jgi:hypothetical protein
VKLPVLLYIVLFSECVAAIVGGFRYRNLPHPLKFLEWLIILSILEFGLQWTLASFNIRNLWVSHFFTLIEITFVVLIYSSWIELRQNRSILSICFSAFVVLWIVSKFTFEPLSHVDGWTDPISKILQIIFSIFILIDIVKESEVDWTSDSRFWIVAGIIIYAAGSIFMSALFNKMLEISRENLLKVWHMNWILMSISNLLFARGFLCKR